MASSEGADEWAEWERGALQALGRGIRKARDLRKLSQEALAHRAGLSKGAIMNLESTSGRVRQLPSIGTLIRIAAALEVPPVALLYPDLPDGEVEILPDVFGASFHAVQWFSGEGELPMREFPAGSGTERVQLSRKLEQLREGLATTRRDAVLKRFGKGISDEDKAEAQRVFAHIQAEHDELLELMRQRGWTVHDG